LEQISTNLKPRLPSYSHCNWSRPQLLAAQTFEHGRRFKNWSDF